MSRVSFQAFVHDARTIRSFPGIAALFVRFRLSALWSSKKINTCVRAYSCLAFGAYSQL